MTTRSSRSRATIREALRICMRREHLRRTVRIALVVGTILTLFNQGDVILRGDATALTWIKTALNYCVPFIVSNLGLLAGKRADA
ncbi:MAG: nitrate/nitrite transporter NrtS [Solirubrobacterales bacterium]